MPPKPKTLSSLGNQKNNPSDNVSGDRVDASVADASALATQPTTNVTPKAITARRREVTSQAKIGNSA